MNTILILKTEILTGSDTMFLCLPLVLTCLAGYSALRSLMLLFITNDELNMQNDAVPHLRAANAPD